uniref:Uncharacterized protein n=1 Tax=Rhizophora mucronata TaxID=61149 RepID=A0A2P2KFL4_RHIMU
MYSKKRERANTIAM